MSDVVLVVAGDPLFAKGIERAFEKAGLQVVVADEAETAMVALEFEKPAAVIVENDLRDKPGSQLARDIRGRDEGNGIPLVLLAGAMMPAAELAPRVFSAGVTACIDSTVDPELLAEAMRLRLAGDADALGRLARGEFVSGAPPEISREHSVEELDDAASAEASIAEAPAAADAREHREAATGDAAESSTTAETGTGEARALRSGSARDGEEDAARGDDSGAPAEETGAPAGAEPAKPPAKIYPPAKPRSGSLGDLAFGALLSELFREHATGVLDLSREKVKKSIWLKDGVPTYAKSNAMGETLGAVLVKMGKITEAQRVASMEAMQKEKEKRKHGDVLVEMGLIRPKDVAIALQAQARAKVINCFAWDDGVYRFVPTDELPDDMPGLKMTFGALVAAGVKQRYDLPRLRKALLPHIGETPRYQDHVSEVLEEMKLPDEEKEVIHEMRGRRSLAEVLALSDMDEEALHRLIVSAWFAGALLFYPEGPVTMQMRLGREELTSEQGAFQERIGQIDPAEPNEDSREVIAAVHAPARSREDDEDDEVSALERTELEDSSPPEPPEPDEPAKPAARDESGRFELNFDDLDSENPAPADEPSSAATDIRGRGEPARYREPPDEREDAADGSGGGAAPPDDDFDPDDEVTGPPGPRASAAPREAPAFRDTPPPDAPRTPREPPAARDTPPPESPRPRRKPVGTIDDELQAFIDREGEPTQPDDEEPPPQKPKRRNRFDDVDQARGEDSVGEPTAPPRADPDVMGKIDAMLTKMSTGNFYDRLGVAEGATGSQVKAAYLRLAKEYHPDRLVTEGGAGVKEKADQLFAMISEAYHTLTDEAKRKKYDDEVLHGKMSDEAASDEAEAILNAEHQFLKGERLLKSGNIQKAFECFKAAVDLYPKETEYQACYGYTLFRVNHPGSPDKAAEGEKIVKSALSTNPKNDKAWYFLGAIAKAKGDNDTAKQNFEKAVAIQPDNVDAVRELRVMEMRDSKGKGISGLFSRGKK